MEYADASLKKDWESKPLRYAEVGIPEYWVLNLKRMELVVFTQVNLMDGRSLYSSLRS